MGDAGPMTGVGGCLWILCFLAGIGIAALLALVIVIGLELWEWAVYL